MDIKLEHELMDILMLISKLHVRLSLSKLTPTEIELELSAIESTLIRCILGDEK
jgi:hypothetical protein